MYSNARRGRGRIGPSSSSGPQPTFGPDITAYSVSNRVFDLNLTISTLTPQVESHIRCLLDEILLRGQFAENAFDLVAYACSLQKERDARILGLVLDLIFEKVKENGEVTAYLGRLFLIFACEILPDLQDGTTTGSDGLPVKGHLLFGRYLLDRCRRELNIAWDEKEKAKEDEQHVDSKVKHWFTLVNLANDLRIRSLLHESVIHDIIDRQLAAPQLTRDEVSILIILLSPIEANLASFKLTSRVDAHYAQLSKLVGDEMIEHGSRQRLKEYIMSQIPIFTPSTNPPSAPPLADQRTTETHPLSASEPSIELQNLRDQTGFTGTQIRDSGPLKSPENAEETIPNFDLSILKDGKFHVDAQTPLTVVIAFFTQIAQPPVADYTTELQSAKFSTNPIYSTAMSYVWRATLQKGFDVAVKCVNWSISGTDKAVKRTARELAAWSQQQHINVLQLLGIALYQGKLAMISEWMDQGSVVDCVNNFPDTDRFSLCVQVIGVVVWLHNRGLVHGDLKGANILVSNNGTPKLTDFGLAIASKETLHFSESYEGGGTIRWMAPELFEEAARKTFKTDVYALGMTMLEILTGQEPFSEILSPHAVIKAISVDRQVPRRPAYLAEKTLQNEVFWNAMVKCWAYDPSLRATAEEIESMVATGGGEGLMKSVSGKRGSSCSGCNLA